MASSEGPVGSGSAVPVLFEVDLWAVLLVFHVPVQFGMSLCLSCVEDMESNQGRNQDTGPPTWPWYDGVEDEPHQTSLLYFNPLTSTRWTEEFNLHFHHLLFEPLKLTDAKEEELPVNQTGQTADWSIKYCCSYTSVSAKSQRNIS